MCPDGVLPQMLCPAGYYQDTAGQDHCEDCTAGNYCYYPDYANDDFAIVSVTACPAGYYCPANTGHPNTYPCAPGTYRDTTGATAASDCVDCPAGSYCPDYAQTSGTTYPCGDGFVCGTGEKTYKGSSKCPKNYYC